ncbi:hypothetical protein QQS21_010699 [Conoideocrella luteorostrata]|uniref:Uncharacterized protein n=1 Tax=Conoideocrella luteorostrata TaxID=1105319 RepID=A0AAJ0CFG5_9HYPO|nr:hypothetical protein QQS21_010699 [Conoideocrella luteorostrata]
MAQPTSADVNGASTPASDDNLLLTVPGKRKRDNEYGAEEMTGVEEQKPTPPRQWVGGEQRDLIKNYFEVLKSIDIEPPILKRPVQDSQPTDEPDTKRQKSSEPPSLKSISDKIASDAYSHMEEIASDVMSAADAALSEIRSKAPDGSGSIANTKTRNRIAEFKQQAVAIFERERAYPKTPALAAPDGWDGSRSASSKGQTILSVVGYAPQERRLFSSLPLSQDIDLTDFNLPPGVTFSRVAPSNPQERTQTLGELFSSPRPLPPLQPPKQPKTQAKGNTLDFYHPELADTAKYRGNCYFNTKLSAGHYLDYSNATPSYQTKTKQRERAQSLAGKKPSVSELETSEIESLFRGAFSSFAPCKDDSAAVISSGIAGRMWWQKIGSRNFQRMVEVEYVEDVADVNAFNRKIKSEEVDEAGVQEAIDNWDDCAIDPSLEDAMGSKRGDEEKEVDDILDEVTDMIETLASYQRIRNLTLPNSQNRQSSDPVNGDMLANSGPQPSEEEQATYDVLKAQLALIIKTLPPYAVAKLNGDQLDDLLISTKIQMQTDQYRGVMEEDDAGVQARIRAQQQQAAVAQATQTSARPPSQQRSASVSTTFANQFQQTSQYATPSRTPSHPQQYFRPMPTPNYQQPRNMGSPAQQPRPPQPNQYTRPNGYPNQYAAQLAKSQTPYGHQNMPQYASQQRPQYGQLQQQGTPSAARFNYQQPYQQQSGTPGTGPNQPSYPAYTNGASMPPRNITHQVPHRHSYSPTPNMQQQQAQRFGIPGQGTPQMNRHASNPAQHAQYSQSPGLTGYHTVIPEAQQQRILEQAKARVAAQERSTMFGDKMSQPGFAGTGTGTGTGIGYGGNMDANRMAAARASLMDQPKPQTPVGQRQGMNGTPTPASQYMPPSKVTPVPVPAIPGAGQPQHQEPPSQQPESQPESLLNG